MAVASPASWRRRLSAARLLMAVVLAIILPLGTLPLGRLAAADGAWDFTAERDALLPDLPAEPAAAAIALVELIYGDDFEVATFATMELLRRAGVPLVNLDGQVAALPDDLVLVDAAVPGEFVPNLSRSVRAGDFYRLEEVDALLVDSGVFPEPLPLDALVAALGRWGKPIDDPAAPAPRPESVTAGAAVRALGATRGQVYFPSADPGGATLDMLQVALLFSHIAADAYTLPGATGSLPRAGRSLAEVLLGVGVAQAAEAGGCVKALETYEKSIGENGGEALWETFKWALGNKDLAEKFDNTKDKIDKVSAILTTLIWLTGIRMDLTVAPEKTHFRHQAGDASRNVTATAYAHFDYPFSKGGAACWKLFANIDAFPQGPLPGFKVRWKIEQPLNKAGTGKLLRPLAGQGTEFSPSGEGGGKTGEDGEEAGKSKVVLEPAVERRPDRGTVNTEKARIVASLDKDDFPFALKDLLGLRDPFGFAKDKTFDLVNSAIRRLGLPTQQVVVPVEYHGTDILVIEGDTTLFALYYFLPIHVQLWTCDGLKGQWEGVAGFKGDRSFLGDAANQVFGVNMPANANMEREENFLLDLTNGFDRAVILEKMGLDIEVDTYEWNAAWHALAGRSRGQVVGTATLTIGGQPAGILAIFDGRSATFDVKRYTPDDFENNAEGMCPDAGGESYFP